MKVNELPLPIQNRLRVLEVLLDQYGYVNRKTLCDLHGLETATVSRDIATYRKLSDGSCFYNQATRRIEKLSNFKRLFN